MSEEERNRSPLQGQHGRRRVPRALRVPSGPLPTWHPVERGGASCSENRERSATSRPTLDPDFVRKPVVPLVLLKLSG